MNKLTLLLLFSATTFLLLHQVPVALAIFYVAIYTSWKDLLLLSYSLKYGVPLPRISHRGNKALIDIGFTYKYSITYLVSLVKHTVEDLAPDDLWRLIKFYLTSIPLSNNISITHVSIKHGEEYKYYIKIDIYPQKTGGSSISQHIAAYKKILENSGISIEPVDYNNYVSDIMRHIQTRTRRAYPGAILDVVTGLLVTYLVYKGLIIPIAFLAPLVAINLAATAARVALRGLQHVSLETPLFMLRKNLSLEYVADENTVYDASRSLYTYISSSKKVLLACTLRRLPSYSKENIGKKAYSLYELGTALDKLSLLAKSKFLYEVLDKRIRRGENLYAVALRYTSDTSQELSSHLDSLGLVTKPRLDGEWGVYTFF